VTSRLLQAGHGSPDYDAIRAALRRDTSVTVAAARGLDIRAAVLPLFRHGDRGLEQAVKISAVVDAAGGDREGRGAGNASLGLILLADGQEADRATVHAGQDALLFVPEVSGPRRFTVEVADAGGRLVSGTLTVTPQRKWTVFAVHHSHLDIGYTDPRGTVLRHHLEYLDSALTLASATRDWPDDARFRWTVESAMPALRWLAARSPQAVAEFVALVREGHIEVTALPFQLHTEACSAEELHRQLRFVGQLRERYGIDVSSAMHTDVPGAVIGLVDALAGARVRYLAAAHNWAGRSVPYLTGGERLPRPFRWRAPSGSEVLVWFTATPHGMAYMEGNTVGLADGYELTLDLLPRYLDALARNPYPYGAEAFGWSGLPAETAAAIQPYPFDLLHLRVQGAHADNAGPSIVPAEIARAWNAAWAYPRLRIATNAEFFRAVEAAYGDRIPVHQGDWTDWWADGLGSGARPLGYVRRAQNMLRAAETLHALASSPSLPSLARTAARAGNDPARDDPAGNDGQEAARVDALDAAYDKVALFNEHTWGAANPWEDAEEEGNSGGLQWTLKSAIAYQAHDDAADLLHSGARRLGARLNPARDTAASYLIVNPGSADRTDIASIFLPREIVPLGTPVTLIDARTGERVAFHEKVVNPEDWPTRPIGRNLHAVASSVPGLGYARFDVVAGGDRAPEPVDLGSGGVIENERYRVSFDAGEGFISSVFDKIAGRELVNTDAAAGFGQYIYERYGTAPRINHLSGHVQAADKALLGSRDIGRRAVIRKAERTPAGERLVVEMAAAGTQWLRMVVDAHREVARVDLTWQIAKTAVDGKEAAYLAFPFASPAPPAAWELTGGIGGSKLPRVPGAAQHMQAIRHWAAFDDPEVAMAWAALEPPLVQFGAIHLPYAPFPPTLDEEPGTVYSWVLNNIWDTNFPDQQHGEMTFRYAVASAVGTPARRLGAATAAGLTDPLIAVLAGSAGADRDAGVPLADAAARFVTIDHPDAQVTSVGRPRDGDGLILRLRSLAAEPVMAPVTVAGAVTASLSCSTGPVQRELAVHAGRVHVPVPACGTAEVVVRFRTLT
jgi:hypothetical protein